MTPAAPTSRRTVLGGFVATAGALAGGALLAGCTPAQTQATATLTINGEHIALLLSNDPQSPGTTPLAEGFPAALAEIGVTVEAQQSTSAQEQLAQLESLKPGGVLIVQPWPDVRICRRLGQLKKAETLVVAVANRPTDPDEVSLFVGWNDFAAGEHQFAALLAALQARQPGRSYNLEHVGSDPRNLSDYYRFRGTALSWKPHRKAGTIAIKTGQISWSQIATRNDDQDVLAARLRTSLQATFGHWPLDGVITGSPAEADTVLAVVAESNKQPPLVVTDGVTESAATRLADGSLTGAVYRDPQEVVAATVRALGFIRQGQPFPVDPQASWRNGYDNLIHDLPAILLGPPVLTRANAASVLADNPSLRAVIG